MKFTKMSLVAALLIGSSAFAIDNVKVSGDAKLYYSTKDTTTTTVANGKTGGLFDAQSSTAQASIGLGVTADLAKGISSGMHVTGITTLGLQGQLVNNVWEGTNGVTDSYIVDQAWVATTLGKTTVKLGRMELDTPLVFSEKWSVATNTFAAAVAINQDLPDTTLVGAYVGQSNSQSVNSWNAASYRPTGGVIQTPANGTTFDQFYKGAYAIAAINNSFKPVVAQVWYFNASTAVNLPNATSTATANVLNGVETYWLQADLNMNGILAGIQYNNLDLQTQAAKVNTDATAVMVGYAMKDVVTVKAAYSTIGKKFAAGFNLAGTGQSKLYTEAWWNYGKITQADTQSYMISAAATVAEIDLYAQYTNANQTVIAGNNDMTEFAVTATKSVGPLDVTAAYIAANIKTPLVANDDETSNTIQAYLTLNF